LWKFGVEDQTNYENLRVFGALEFANIKKDKLETWTKRHIFIEYIEGLKRYKF